jgi:hypothetical protein
MKVVFNPITGLFDLIGMTTEEMEAYLKIDQTTPQNIINGAPQFDKGLVIKENEWVNLDGA